MRPDPKEQVELIAKICHNVNRAYCRAIGDNSQPTWDKTPDNIKQSAIDGVLYKIDNPNSTPEKQHENWLKFKEADGWIYGEVKDVEKKTHPCMVPYKDLPKEQQIKDALFGAVVRSFLP